VIARDDESNRLYFLLVRILRTIIQTPRLSQRLGISPIECLDYRLAASLVEGIGDSCVQLAERTIALKGAKLSGNSQKLLIELQTLCYEAHANALKAFLTKDASLAEDVRNLKQRIDSTYSSIEQLAKGSSVDLMPQLLAAATFLRQIYERSVDMADLVV
jgi:phosphate uptake regulator